MAAIILGIIGALFTLIGLIPLLGLVNFISIPLLVIGLICGIIGICKKNEKRGSHIAGTIICVIFLFIACWRSYIGWVAVKSVAAPNTIQKTQETSNDLNKLSDSLDKLQEASDDLNKLQDTADDLKKLSDSLDKLQDTSAPAEPQKNAEPDMTVTAAQLLKEFKDSDYLFNQKYENKRLKVSGAFIKIRENAVTRKPIVQIETDLLGVDCLPNSINDFIHLKKGDQITIIGVGHKNLFNPEIIQCELTKDAPAQPIADSWPIQFHGNVPAADAQKIAQLLNQWNNAMNSHDADVIANTHTNDAMIRGKNYTIAAYSDKEAKAFAKHPDFQQSPANDVYATPLADKSGYHLIFDETFTQGGKSTPTEIMLVVVRQGTDYKISYESDISTDRNLIKKMGINTYTSSADCKQLNGQIVMESPMFRHEYIPTESLSLLCEDDECGIGVGENGIVTEFYEFDHKAMKLIIKDAMSNKGATYDINPKYASQIRKLCH